jgi:hypothetical protein
MDVHATGGSPRAVRRIMALLVALAVLAERADARCWAVRCFVLWILRRVEGVAGDFVLDATGAPPPAIAAMAVLGNSHTEAMLLAARFRALAAALGVLLSVGCEGRPVRRGRVLHHVETWPVAVFLDGWAPRTNDTS